MKKKIRVLLSVFIAALFLAACGKTEPGSTDNTDNNVTPTATETPLPTLTPAPSPTPRPDPSSVSLKEVYEDDFMLGTIYTNKIDYGPDYDLTSQHFNIVTPENNMKPSSLQATQGKFNFAQVDRMLIATEGVFDLVGHTLCWHQQSPTWMGNSAANREEAIEQLRNHITTVCEYFAGSVYSWDVLNEAIADGAVLPADGDWTKCLRETQWTKSIGSDYVALAFQFAHEADPNAVLYYNDYNLNSENKAKIVAAMVSDLRSQGVPIHGIGMQGHYNTGTQISGVRNSLDIFSQIEGIKISVTELDVCVPGAGAALTAKQEKAQALVYAKLFQLYKEYADVIERVTIWGYRDDTSWRSEQFPLIFNSDLTPKEAFYAVLDPEGYIAEAEGSASADIRTAAAFQGTPVIDGEKDSVWLTTTNYKIESPLFAWQGASGTVRLLWDTNHIYALVEVTDGLLNASSPNRYEHDSVEIYLDPENTKATTYSAQAGHYRVNYEGMLSFGTVPTEQGVEAKTTLIDNGYIVEIAIPLATAASTGDTFGFDAQINDSDENGTRQSVMMFNDLSGGSHGSTSGWGELELK